MAVFSKKVLRLLSDELTETVLRDIDVLFENNDVMLGPPQPDDGDPSVRRERMRSHLGTLNLSDPSDAAKLARVFSDLMHDIAHRGSDFHKDKWLRILRADGFNVDESTWEVSDPGRTEVRFTPEALGAITDASVILDHLGRLGDKVNTDPRSAVSTAKALIESTAKLVITSRGLEYSKNARVPALVNAAQESLGLDAKGAGEEEPALRKVLQSLATLAQGVAEIRNKVGVDHGAESVPNWVRPRHARLVVGAAQVWCQLMLETLADPDAPWRRGTTTT